MEAGRLSRLLGVFVLIAVTSGCATKRDIGDLRDDLRSMQARQDSMYLMLATQHALMQDSLEGNRLALIQVRGDLLRQLLTMEEQLFQIQELTGQSQRRLSELREQYERRSAQITAPMTQPTPGTASPTERPAQPTQPGQAGPPPSGEAEELYQAGREQLERGNVRTARQAFSMILSNSPSHRLAPDAQYSLAETYVEEDPARALSEFERVQELFPNSSRAPAALYRAGVIAQNQGDTAQAREYFQRVVRGYPRSDEAATASEALSRLRS